jgi:outer membrane lipopolysaccharide assembly protein LptE/RlpB
MTQRLGRIAAMLAIGGLVVLQGCVYSFTGASVPPHLKTIAIPLIDDQSGFGEAGLREQFTTQLQQLFISDNSLEVADRAGADAILEGAIVSINDAPAVVSQGEQVTRRRITVSARFTFQDMKLRKKMWEKSFSQWGDYDSGGGLSQRSTGIQDALKKIADDVLLETVSGW